MSRFLFAGQHIVFWGGLRGSLSIALVLNLPGREQLVAMTFGAVTFNLLVQGLIVSPLLTLLKIKRVTPAASDLTAKTIPSGTEVE